jgi:mycothiol synthase
MEPEYESAQRHTIEEARMSVVARGYQGEEDFQRVRQLLIESLAITKRIHNWWLDRWDVFRYMGHSSDEIAGTRRWEADVHLWEVLGDYASPAKLVGVVNPEDGADFFIQIHPHFRHLERETVAWAEEHHLASRPKGAACGPLNTVLREHDTERADLLLELGFKNLGHCGYTRWRSVEQPLPDVSLPKGYSVRSLRSDDDADLENRAAVANLAFNSRRNTPESVRILQSAPTYREDLDLVVVAPDGSFASYCIIWFGEENRIGWYEPVGTHPAHRRRGLAKGMMCEGLRRLAALGATQAYVGVGTGEAANRLYESVGFSEEMRDYHWQKTF